MSNNPLHPAAAVLVAVKDVAYGSVLKRALSVDGHAPEVCHDARGVLRVLGRRHFDVIVLDLELEAGDVDLVSFVRRQSADSQIILLFEMAGIERALDGIRRGAFFYLPKHTPPADVALVVAKAIRATATQNAVAQFQQSQFEELLGDTPAMRRVIELVRKVSPTDSTVLLLGESGTGKEVLAHTIHRLSMRREMPFIAINCAALPEQLLESEMFGHVKGAFTGATADKRGLFEEADGGTIFLDEIGDMALVTQAKLLRVLQNGESRRVGATTSHRVDVRVLAATNRNLEQAVAEDRFREDLYFRLNVIQIRIPPLRERLDVLPRLIAHFLALHNAKFGKRIQGVDEAAHSLLLAYAYPGNVRELSSIIAHGVIVSDGPLIRVTDLPDQVRFGVRPRLALPSASAPATPTIAGMEEQLIRSVLDTLEGNQTEAAKRLGISRSTLWRKMKEYRIPR